MDKRFRLISIVLAVLAVPMIVALVFLLRHISAEHARVVELHPAVVNDRAPEMSQPFVCNLNSGFHSGEIRTYLRNAGNERAIGVVPTFLLRVVPQRRVGIPVFDEIPAGDCRDRPFGIPAIAPIETGQRGGAHIPSPSVTLPPLLHGEGAQLYGVSCAYYTDDAAGEHASCDTYHFKLADGSSVFMCDGMPKSGQFESSPTSNCGL